MDLRITGATLITSSGESRADLAIDGGKIVLIGADLTGLTADREIEADGKLVLPGLIDAHVRLWETNAASMTEATRAAAIGGVTSVLTFAESGKGKGPQAVLEKTRGLLSGAAAVDWGLHLEVTDGRVAVDVAAAIRSHGVASVHIALRAHEISREVGDGEALAILQAVAGQALAVAHCENGPVTRHLLANLPAALAKGGTGHAQGHPAWMEAEAIGRAAALAGAVGAHLLAAPVTSQEGLEAVRRAKESTPNILAATTPVHLSVSRDLLEGDEDHLWVTEPPLRPKGDAQPLWRALDSGLLDAVASHHHAVPRKAKEAAKKSVSKATPGLPGIETMLPTLWSEGVEKWRLTPQALVATVCEMPAKLFGLYPRKGAIEVGADADLVILDPEQVAPVEVGGLHMGIDYHPLAGKPLKGWPVMTILRGQVIAENGGFTGAETGGDYVERKFSLS